MGFFPPLSNNAGLYAADLTPIIIERSRAGRHGFLGLPALQTHFHQAPSPLT